MPPIKKICKLTGRAFEVSELEQELRKKFNTPLPDVHPYERMRELLSWRNLNSLYNAKCDLCKKFTLSMYGPHNQFPVYCLDCWFSDKWQPPEQKIDFSRPFFEQFRELRDKTPHAALSVKQDTMVNSPYNNNCSGLKNCYMCFDANGEEDCYYMVNDQLSKDSIDCFNNKSLEQCYELIGSIYCYNVHWSQYVEKCIDSAFLYACDDCTNCFMSSYMQHKHHVFRNEQLTKEEYQRRMVAVDFGSARVVEKLKQEFEEMKAHEPLPYRKDMISENVTGDHVFGSHNIVDSYFIVYCENMVNCAWVIEAKDCLDVANFGGDTELCYQCVVVGHNAYQLHYTWNSWDSVSDLAYCFHCTGTTNSYGCVGLRHQKYCILNKPYTKDEYGRFKEKLITHMKETGEYWHFFPQTLNPFGYNESVAELSMPLTKEEALARGFQWYEKTIPVFPPEKIYTPPDHITDAVWEELEGNVIVCEESRRPFNIIKQEFEFYKKHTIPLPRLHPDVRLEHRFPRAELYNLHETTCETCGVRLATTVDSPVLCKECYFKRLR